MIELRRQHQHRQQRERQGPDDMAQEDRPETEFQSEERAQEDEERGAHRHARHEERQHRQQHHTARAPQLGNGTPHRRRHDHADQPDGERQQEADPERLRPAPILEQGRVVLERQRIGDAGERALADRHQSKPDQREIGQRKNSVARPFRELRPALPIARAPSHGRCRRKGQCDADIRGQGDQLRITLKEAPRSATRRDNRIRRPSSIARIRMTKVESAATTGYLSAV